MSLSTHSVHSHQQDSKHIAPRHLQHQRYTTYNVIKQIYPAVPHQGCYIDVILHQILLYLVYISWIPTVLLCS